MQYWLTAGTYNDLYNTLYETDPAKAAQFAAFFQGNGDSSHDSTFFKCINYDGYMNWLQSLFGDDPIGDDFIAWSDYQFGVSNQNTGGL